MQRIGTHNVIKDDGNESVVEYEQIAGWRFLWMTGEFKTTLQVTQERASSNIRFQMLSSNVMRKFSGSWVLQPYCEDNGEQDKGGQGFHNLKSAPPACV